MKYETVIGLEVHVELNTKTKMFCSCSANYFGAEPNTHTCPVCLGLPGALPFINKEAIDKCIKIGLALNCTQNPESYFERKNYFYPDLAKGYQISQLVKHANITGWIEVEDDQGNLLKIRINRAHQEEDTGKLTHKDGETLVDFNRSGVPLVEIVTEPDFTNSAQIRDYAKKLQQIFRSIGVSNADMERGDMRLEANISVRPEGQKELPPYRVELKNINSFRFMVAAVEYEIKRQIEALEKGEKLSQETRGWNEDKKETYLQRSKEEAHDYRYFPEPDLPEIKIDVEWAEALKKELPELPQVRIERWMRDYGLSKQDGQVLAESEALGLFFEEAVKMGQGKDVTPKQIANFIVNQKVNLVDYSLEQLIDDVVAKRGGSLDDSAAIEVFVDEAISENPGMVESYKAGKLTVIQALIGQVMRKSGGKANSAKVKELLEEKLK
jgi:aspartyl-tRNA(Asn)/glutamyl-tRNA(Gln) amidotransferase subunit B